VIHEQIQLSGPEERHIGRPELGERDVHLRVAPVERAEPARQQLLDEERGGADPQHAAEAARPERIHRDPERLEEGSDHVVEGPAVRGEHHPVLRRPAEEAHPELGLESPDLLMHPGLGDGVREGTDRARVPAGARHPVEAGETVQGVHAPQVINLRPLSSFAETTWSGTVPPNGRIPALHTSEEP
jgi:hypothetical protein